MYNQNQRYPTFRYYYSGGSGDAVDGLVDGQLLIGNSNGIPVLTGLTEGPGITITNGPGSIVITATGAGGVSEMTSVVNTTTTSLTDVPMDSMTETPGAGDFLVFFSGVLDNDAPTTSTVTFSLYRDGVVVPSSVTLIEASKNEPHNVTTMAFMENIDVAEDIEVRWKVGSDVGTCHERRMVVQKIPE